ncbi:MAG: methyltransferase domain-containing protein [Proteobacteria bacterium]|nr:methyltransferase domain-containing protein [Pseudomonadota bacterium]
MFETREASLACPTGDIVLVQDPSTGLVSNIAYDPLLLRYDETYQNEQGLSTHFRTHLDQVLTKIATAFNKGRILEIGCGKGLFVEMMRSNGLDAYGMDKAYEGNASFIEKRHFGSQQEMPANAIVLRHVLEHIPDPLQFLQMVADANGGCGQIYIEVPCFDWILRRRAWFDIFYEHVNYFRLSDFHRLFGQVSDSGHIFGGQYVYAIADISSLRTCARTTSDQAITFPTDFIRPLDMLTEDILAVPSRRRAIWGGGAKGVMFVYHIDRRGVRIDTAIDINPGKQGRYLAASGILVSSPEVVLPTLPAGSEIYVMNSNYLAEISTFGGSGFNYTSVDNP